MGKWYYQLKHGSFTYLKGLLQGLQGERWGPNWADQGLGGKWSFQPITSRDYFRWRDGLNHTSTLCDLLWPNVGLLPDCCQAPLHWSFAGKVFFTWRTKKGDHKSTNMGYEWYSRWTKKSNPTDIYQDGKTPHPKFQCCTKLYLTSSAFRVWFFCPPDPTAQPKDNIEIWGCGGWQ